MTTYGGLDVLVNNVGAATPAPADSSVTDEEWTASLAVNFLAAVRTTRAALPHLLERGAATIVTTCSVNAFLPDPLVIDYSAAKAALANFSKSLSKEVGPRGVRVNTVSPGPVATDLWLGKDGVAATVAGPPAETPTRSPRRRRAGRPPAGSRTPQEVADLVVLLASGRAGNVTGADFVIDGGLVQTL